MRILFGRLVSDQPDLLNGELSEAENVIPYAQSYGPFPSLAPYSNSASATVIGAVSTKDLSGNVYNFVATNTTIYKESAGSLENVSFASVTYAAASTAKWEFEVFGNTLLGVNGTDVMQVYTLGTSTVFANQSASASAPVAAHIATVRDFIMVGNLTNANSTVQWSQINNPLRWTISQRYQADVQVLPGINQAVKRITGGDFAAILTESSVWRASYVGTPLIFRFDELAPGIGCIAGGAAARFQNNTFFPSDRGFYVFDGSQAAPIGNETIDDTFKAEVERSLYHRMSAAIDPVNKLYIVSYPSTASSGAENDRLMIYAWELDKFAFATVNTELVYGHMTSGYTLEGLDVFGTMETLPFSLDSPVWQGGLPALGAITSNHEIGRFEGSALTARFTTGEAQIVEDNRAFVNSIRPLVQGGSSTAITTRIGARDRLIDGVTWSGSSAMNSIGACPHRTNSRYHRIQMEISGGFERAMGFDINLVKDGMR